MSKCLVPFLFAFLVGCANNAQFTNYESEGDLAATNPLPCVSATSESAELIMVASAYAFFDTQRVADKTAHSALSALFAKEFGSLPEKVRNELLSSIDALNNNQPRKNEICSYLLSSSEPSYFPKYMIAHGMGSFTESAKEPLINSFNASEAWSESMAYIKCSS